MDADLRSQPLGRDRLHISKNPKPEESGGGGGSNERTTRRELDIHDYLEAAIDAGSRARNVTITMVVACTLVFVAVINSLQNSWMLQRIKASSDPTGPYVAAKIDSEEHPLTSKWKEDVTRLAPSALSQRERRYDAFYGALWKSYIDNSYYVRVPFFGFALDANDIGVFAGIAFTVILLMMRFCLAREIENLRASFHRVTDPHDRYEFYMLLSMRQVFTVPKTDLVHRSWFASITPKAIWLAPVAIESLVTWHDYQTAKVGQTIDDLHTAIIIWSNLMLVGIVLVLTLSVIRRMLVIDRRWDAYWGELEREKLTAPVRREPIAFVTDPIRWTGEHIKVWWQNHNHRAAA